MKGLAVVGLAVLAVTAAGASGPGGPVALSVSHAPTPPLPVEQFETSGSYPHVLLGRRDFGAVNRALRRAVLADQRAYTPYAQRERPRVRDQGPGIYKTSVRRGYVSASTVVVSALMPLTRELFPGQPEGDGWLGVTIRVPSGRRVAIDELFTNRRRGISALAAAWKARVRRTPGRPCLRLYPAHYAASIANYRAFALTPRGIAIGSWELAACYRLVATVPYRVIRPYLSGLGARLVAGVRAPKRFVRGSQVVPLRGGRALPMRPRTVIGCLTVGVCESGQAAGTAPRGTIAVRGGGTPNSISLISPATGATGKVLLRRLTIAVALSPDGRRLAVGGFKGIWVTHRDGASARRVLGLDDRQAGVAALAWSPDGRRLAFIRDETLYTIAVKGGAVARLTDHADAPDWSADGREIVFVENPERSSRDGRISAIRVAGGTPRRVVRAGAWFGPSISPDGSKVAFYRNGVPGIYVAPTEGGRARLIIRNGFQPKWSPDGRYLAFLRDVDCGEAQCSQRTFVAPASGGKAQPYGPVLGDMRLFSWSGDRKACSNPRGSRRSG